MRLPLVVVLFVLALPIVATAAFAGRAGGGVARRLAVAVGIVLLCGPIAVIVTFALLPLWRWLEAAHGVESVGHSGPAEWCYLASYLACSSIVSGAHILSVRRKAARRRASGGS